jgi:hypothetical protein
LALLRLQRRGILFAMRSGRSEANWVRAMYVVLAIFYAPLTRAQQPVAVPEHHSGLTGSIVGYVYDERELPVRFAEIRLIPRSNEVDPTQVENQRATLGQEPHLSSVRGVSGIDGSFRVDGVPTGDYFAGALMAGYVTSGTLAATAIATGDQLKRMIASMPAVHVAAGQIASVNLTLQHGAVITGRVRFADGSPATGFKLQWELAERDLAIESIRMARPSPLQETLQAFEYYTQHPQGAETDDEGRYRIFGLSPGKYIVGTIIASQVGSGQVMSDGSGSGSSGRVHAYPEMTMVYEPGVFRRKNAKVFEIRGEEEVTDADLKIDPSGLHTVRGKVLAGEDRHVPSQAMIRVREDGKDIDRLVMIEDDGSFQIDYVPSGSYTLEVMGAPDMTIPTSPTDFSEVLRNYKMAKVAVEVGEHDVVLDVLVLIALKPGEKMEWFR